MLSIDRPLRFPFIGALFLVACSSSSTPAPPSNADNDGNGNTATVREALEFIAPCAAETCGEVPSSSKATKPACAPTAGTCSWSDPASDSVSFRQCPDADCGAEPDASVCPSGTTFKGATCGSENEGACVWRSACVPPPSTTPCPDVDGCGGKPMLGVICKDGSTGDLECMKTGATCSWQRTCE
jgi:hypothetical protein